MKRPGSVFRACGRAIVAVAALATLAAAPAAAQTCAAKSGPRMAALVELYTSEGCDSCPPADRWLSSTVPADANAANTIGIAFHVDYWDRLGWKDRFASTAFTARQAAEQTTNGARFSYTPQVVVDGRDRTDWSRARVASAARPSATVDVALAQRGDRFVATVTPGAGSPKRLAAYWAVTEQGHSTAVRAGENEGATLHHDFVVRDYEPVAAWAARSGAAETIAFTPSTRSDAAHPRSINLVVLDAATGRPVQAVKVGC